MKGAAAPSRESKAGADLSVQVCALKAQLIQGSPRSIGAPAPTGNPSADGFKVNSHGRQPMGRKRPHKPFPNPEGVQQNQRRNQEPL